MTQRINKAIELLEEDQPVYYLGSHHGNFELDYESGRRMASTWADFLNLDMEHGALDLVGLRAFMRGLVDGGATASDHRTPAVIVECPLDGSSEATVRANAWQFRQVLAAGVHGILLCHAEHPDAVRAFVESCRYPFQSPAAGQGQGRRGSGGQDSAAAIWGLDVERYLHRADPWPLNPQGELFLGLKIENRRALEHAEESVSVPGIAFAEWGPGDMGMSLGYANHHDPPYPPEMLAARERVKQACAKASVPFLNMVSAADVAAQLDEGVRICSVPSGDPEIARRGRAHTGRKMPV